MKVLYLSSAMVGSSTSPATSRYVPVRSVTANPHRSHSKRRANYADGDELATVACNTIHNLPDLVDSGNRSHRVIGPTWKATAYAKLKSMSTLQVGWDHDGAEPPTSHVLSLAGLALEVMQKWEFEPSRVAACVEGGVTFTFLRPGKYADLEIFNTGEILIATEFRGDTPTIEDMTSAGVEKAVRHIERFLNAR